MDRNQVAVPLTDASAGLHFPTEHPKSSIYKRRCPPENLTDQPFEGIPVELKQ
jgi:hypothetical protein